MSVSFVVANDETVVLSLSRANSVASTCGDGGGGGGGIKDVVDTVDIDVHLLWENDSGSGGGGDGTGYCARSSFDAFT